MFVYREETLLVISLNTVNLVECCAARSIRAGLGGKVVAVTLEGNLINLQYSDICYNKLLIQTRGTNCKYR